MKIRPFCDGRSAAVHPVEVMIMDSSGCRKAHHDHRSERGGGRDEPRGVRVVRDHFPGGGTYLVRLWIPEFEPFDGVEGEADH